MPEDDQLSDNSPISTINDLESTDREQELIAELTSARNSLHRALANVASLETDYKLLAEQSRRQSTMMLELYRARTYLLAKVAKEYRKRERLERSIWRRISTPLKRPSKTGRRTDDDEKTGMPSRSTETTADPSLNLPTGLASYPASVQSPAAWVPLAIAGPSADFDVQAIAFYASGQNELASTEEASGTTTGQATDLADQNPCLSSHPPHRASSDSTKWRLRRQVQLAQIYGITGFCLPYSETQQHRSTTILERYNDDVSLKLDYCICWSNESGELTAVHSRVDWNREIHSTDANERLFIRRIAHHFHDQRYLRICGRAVLIISRPDLLADPAATVSHWRAWCEENAAGELFLLYREPSTRSGSYQHLFDGVVAFRCCDPATMSGDPMNNKAQNRPSTCTERGTLENRHDRSCYENAQVIFQNVGPGCFSSRDGSIGEMQPGLGPHDFRLALEAASQQVRQQVGAPRMVFIGPWNSSPGPPRLEPDMLNGYAYLEATRQGLRCSGVRRMRNSRKCRLALVLHVFYIDVFIEMIPMIKRLSVSHDIFVTCPHSLHNEVVTLVGTLGRGAVSVEAVPNRGRDVAPFLFMMEVVDCGEYDVVLKMHTKKSPHHPNGGSWGRDILGKLLDQERARVALGELRSGSKYGILGSEGSVVSMEYYRGPNLERVLHLARMMGFVPLPGSADVFVAGTMFYARIDALRPLLDIGLTFGDFEPETGQTDGALAHVIERAASYSALAAGYQVGELALTRDGMVARVPDVDQARLSLTDHL